MNNKKPFLLLLLIIVGLFPIFAGSKNDCFFFPKGALADPSASNKEESDQFSREWYSKHLIAMKEPSLSIPGQKPECAYRFLWLRTFHHPISVRIEKWKDSVTVYSVELTGKGGYDPGKIKKKNKFELSSFEYEYLGKLLVGIDFWNMPTYEPVSEDGTYGVGVDGAQWILEGNCGGKYHVVDRWSPEYCKYQELGLFFLKLSGLKILLEDIY